MHITTPTDSKVKKKQTTEEQQQKQNKTKKKSLKQPNPKNWTEITTWRQQAQKISEYKGYMPLGNWRPRRYLQQHRKWPKESERIKRIRKSTAPDHLLRYRVEAGLRSGHLWLAMGVYGQKFTVGWDALWRHSVHLITRVHGCLPGHASGELFSDNHN